ncbi:ubiquinol-cytochrome c reductase iron-sulfur subunit [Merismopedia glauca]|uniref:Cytochrome B6 n=1 Tax=Merismopedia glauca CCAP 1448/3 TaxID=1296344 RepID=A0A2T1CA94_9CYAN|nr:Rieske 2Fe-2S domain-containing protein [Merismopedia glauca]PSB05195.1 cytochrome B6 [Merismopedia glauca CCAP 1448/3]
MQRREFCQWFGVGCLASYFPIALAACSPNEPTSTTAQNSSATPRSDGFTSVGAVSQLDSGEGQILNKQAAKQPVLVVRSPEDSKKLLAVNPTCPHKQCTVAWQGDIKSFVCPCHNSRFAADGKVTNGPATQPLPKYEAKIEGNAVLVKVS